MAFSRDIERMARAFVAQKLDPAYIRHYLMEAYQLDEAAVEKILEKVGAARLPAGPSAGAAKPEPAKPQVNRQSFY